MVGELRRRSLQPPMSRAMLNRRGRSREFGSDPRLDEHGVNRRTALTKETAMTGLRLLIVLALITGLNVSVAQQNQGPTPAAKAATPFELNIRYAEVYLQLAKVQLQRAVDTNKQVPGTFTNVAIEALRQIVFVAQEQLDMLKKSSGRPVNMFLVSAEANSRASAAAYNRAKAVNQMSPGAIPAAEIERLRLTAELASINLEKAKTIGDESSQEYVQWQIDQLREEFFQIRNQLAQISRMN
jgi:type II secretory pathway pseudopilin PulG